jgi:hypothetical protein
LVDTLHFMIDAIGGASEYEALELSHRHPRWAQSCAFL